MMYDVTYQATLSRCVSAKNEAEARQKIESESSKFYVTNVASLAYGKEQD